MRRQILFFVFFQTTVTCLIAQGNIPTIATGPGSATPKALPSYNPSPLVNYLRTLVPVMPTTDSARVTINAWADTVNISTHYVDALGRPLQTVIKQASPSKEDYVSPNVYDEFGRMGTSYLPYAQTTGSNNNGKFKTTQFVYDSTFYKTNFSSESINYSQATYDATPLQRVTKTTAPGNSWTGSNVGISNTWRANAVNDSVRLWTIAISTEDDIPATSSIYTAGSLSIQETTDERGVKMVTYKDELGRTILTKQQVNASPTTGHYGWLCTYYVYDEMNRLRVVIPPKAVDALNTSTVNWNLSGNIAIKNGLCFSYFYDARGRVIMKYIPGKGKNYIAYDLFDRVVMTQDPNLKQTNQWAFVKYDGQSRAFRSGVITTALIKDSIIAQAARATDYPTLTGTYIITSETYFDDYSWITGSIPNSTLVSTYINSTNFNTSYNMYPDYAQSITVSNRLRGMVTGSKRIILNTSSTYLYDVPLYDDHGRPIQIKETNYTGGTDVLTKQYRFNGTVLRTHLYHQKSGTNAQTHTLLTKYAYDHVGRIKAITKNIDGLGDKTIATNTYNELGQLKSKVLGSGIDSMAYSYNIRGWLTGINKSYVDTYNSSANYFGEDLFYDYGFTNNQLNGAIAGVKWKAGGDTIARAYGFTYDNPNRLTKADFSQNIRNTTTWTNSSIDFTVSNLTYDGGGNILTMKQRGLFIGTSTTIDSLAYTYTANSNQLQKVGDAITDASPLGDFKDSALATDYTYDVNGNITKDYNRHMHTTANGSGAVYNLLDKPDSMVIANKATLYYYYDAAGTKLRKQVNDYSTGSVVIKNYLYIDGFVYLNDTLQYVNEEEGRIRWAKKRNNTNGTIYYAFEYDYFLRDHLGNVRTVITEGKDTATYAATMETADSVTVQALFSNVYDPVRTVVAKPSAFDTDPNNHNVSKLTGNAGGRIGPSIVLKVMAGDKVQINTYAYFTGAVQTPVSDNTLLTDLLTTLVSGVTAQSGGKIGSGNATQLSNAVSPNVLSFLNNRSYSSSLPKAYLNWVLLDDQFKYVAGNMGALQVQSGTSKQALVAPLQTMAKNGYLYVYLSNQSPQDVYFDDLIVTHTTGPLLQEQSYYPFGLQMAGISDKAMIKLDSKKKFNGGVEFEEDYGVNLYSTFYREYDPQIGRFGGVDVLSEKTAGISVYNFVTNNPVNFIDPKGNYKEYYNQYLDHIMNNNTPAGEAIETRSGDGFGGGGSGNGDYSAFWNNVLYGDNSLSTEVSTTVYYEYSNLSGSGVFETPNNDGVYTEQVGEIYHFVTEIYSSTYTPSSQGNYNSEDYGWDASPEEKAALVTAVSSDVTSRAFETGKEFAYSMASGSEQMDQLIGLGRQAGAFAKVLQGASVAGNIVTTGLATYRTAQEYQNGGIGEVLKHRDVEDATVGAVGLTATALTTLGIISNPVGWAIGIGVLGYGIGTLIYDSVSN